MSGSLCILGLGPARPEHMTVEALHVLQQAEAEGWHVYGLGHARGMAHRVCPDLNIKSLDYIYGLAGVDRPTAYQDLAKMMWRKAYAEGRDVLYLVAGSPLFYNDAVLFIRRLSVEAHQAVRLVHGMSFVDLVLDRVHWTGHDGLQLYSAWNVAFDGVRLNPQAPTLLCQLGEFTAGGDALDPSGSKKMLVPLRDALQADFPADHPVTIVYSSGPPDYESLSARLPLSALADRTVPVYSNLFVPGTVSPDEGLEAP
jgi:uncharacterized protein YabN with tetrapyrrole methylase and pyrophosphatase domain